MNPSSDSRRLPQPNLILGIDPGSSVIGYGLVCLEGSSVRAVDWGILRPRRGCATLPARLASLFPQIETLFERLAPGRLAVEGVFTHRNVRSALALAHARGIILLAAERAGLPVSELAPRLVKQTATGSGAAGKEQVAAMLRLELHLPDGPLIADASDALAVALCEARSTAFRRAVERAASTPPERRT